MMIADRRPNYFAAGGPGFLYFKYQFVEYPNLTLFDLLLSEWRKIFSKFQFHKYEYDTKNIERYNLIFWIHLFSSLAVAENCHETRFRTVEFENTIFRFFFNKVTTSMEMTNKL